MPRRNGFAYFLALFFPYAGRMGAGFGFLILVYIFFIFAAVAIPAYQDKIIKANLGAAVIESQAVREALVGYYLSNNQVPDSLERAGVSPQLADGSRLSLDPNQMVLTVSTRHGDLVFTPTADAEGRITWVCKNGEGLKPTQLPPSCQQ